MQILELNKSVTGSNDRDAEALRRGLSKQGTLLVNVMSSPGAGKTTFIKSLAGLLEKDFSVAVIEADIDSDTDAVKLEEAGIKSIQVHTDGMCHMDAGMTKRAIEGLGDRAYEIIFLENVGNLICPAEFDTGAHLDIMLLSVPEGDDKPLKYPLMFHESDALFITKCDTLEYFSFDIDECKKRVRGLNKDIDIFTVSAKTGVGMAEAAQWIKKHK